MMTWNYDRQSLSVDYTFILSKREQKQDGKLIESLTCASPRHNVEPRELTKYQLKQQNIRRLLETQNEPILDLRRSISKVKMTKACSYTCRAGFTSNVCVGLLCFFCH